jgi:hypothetical protein
VLVPMPTTLAGVLDALDELFGAHMLTGSNYNLLSTPQKPIPVPPDHIAISAEPAASTG